MELLPLLIIVGGILYSVVASNANKKNEDKRNIDPSKMERRGNSAPRRRQPENSEDSSSGPRGFFDDLKREFTKEYEKAMGTDERPSTTERSTGNKGTNNSKRIKQEAEKKIREFQKSPEKQKRDFQRNNPRYQTEHSKRATESKQAVYSEGYSREDGPRKSNRVAGIGRDVADQVRYEYGDDRTQVHRRNQTKRTRVTKGDLSFDQRAVVNGIIFSEILGKPKSKQ